MAFLTKGLATKDGWIWGFLALSAAVGGTLFVGVRELRNTQEALDHSREALEISNELARKRYGIDLITQWNKDTVRARSRVHRVFTDLLSGTKGRASVQGCLCSGWTEEEWERLYLATDTEEDGTLAELREDVVVMLNYWEAVAVSYDLEIADHDVIENSLKALMLRWHECFGGFLFQATRHVGSNPWKPLSRQVQQWRDRGTRRLGGSCPDRDPSLVK